MVIKAQVLATGRGRAGGIRLVNTPDAAEEAAQEIMGRRIGGLPVRRVLVERAVDIRQQLYLGLSLDPSGEVRLGMSAEVAPLTEAPQTLKVDYNIGLLPFQVRELGWAHGLSRRTSEALSHLGMALWRTFIEMEALRIDLNPLALTPAEELVVVDAKLTLDDNALYRHPELADIRGAEDDFSVAELEARSYGLTYVALEGNVGTMVNGAGLAMAVSDLIALRGGRPANILDIGGGARAARVASAMRILLRNHALRSLLVGIYGGITRCDEVAQGILMALEEHPTDLPIYARLTGTNEHEARQLLAGTQVQLVSTLAEGANAAVAAAEAGR